MSAAPLIDWTSLGTVATVSFVFGVAIVTLFSLGILGLSRVSGHRADPDDAPASDASAAGRSGGIAVASVCFAVCAAGVGYGLYLILPQSH